MMSFFEIATLLLLPQATIILTGRHDKPFCTNYGFLGHAIYKFYKIHGYPPSYKPEGKFYEPSKSQQDHYKPVINQAGTPTEQEDHIISNNSAALTTTQCQQLISFLSNQMQSFSS